MGKWLKAAPGRLFTNRRGRPPNGHIRRLTRGPLVHLTFRACTSPLRRLLARELRAGAGAEGGLDVRAVVGPGRGEQQQRGSERDGEHQVGGPLRQRERAERRWTARGSVCLLDDQTLRGLRRPRGDERADGRRDAPRRPRRARWTGTLQLLASLASGRAANPSRPREGPWRARVGLRRTQRYIAEGGGVDAPGCRACALWRAQVATSLTPAGECVSVGSNECYLFVSS